MCDTIEGAIDYSYVSEWQNRIKFLQSCRADLGPIIIIPSKLAFQGTTYNLKKIEMYALKEFTKITDVTITEGIETINTWAFYNCSNLKTVQIPNSLTFIDRYGFYECKQVILTFVSGGNTIMFAYFTPISGIFYHRNNTMEIYVYNYGEIIPIYTNDTNLIIIPDKNKFEILPLPDTPNPTKLPSKNKNIPSCQKSKSPLNLLLITQMTINS